MSSSFANQYLRPYEGASTWSRTERVIARTAFDAALNREFQEVMEKTKQRANRLKEPADIWKLERYLTRRRKEIDKRYDFRYSQLTHVFGWLLYEKRLSEEELAGLREDKLEPIRSFAKFLASQAAA